MEISNNDIRRISEQLFASSNSYQSPFYNRTTSQEEIRNLLNKGSTATGPLLISYPLGTGKTFFIEQISGDVAGIQEAVKPLYVRDITPTILNEWPHDILFVDECDIKTPWATLEEGLKHIADYIQKTQRQSVVVGDYCLRNPVLASFLPECRYLNTFEWVDREFLQGIMNERLREYLKLTPNEAKDIVDDELYAVLTPDDMVESVSFRAVLATLEQISRSLPANSEPCRLTLDMAKDWVENKFDPPLTTARQEEYLNRLLDFIAAEYPRGKGLKGGWSTETLLQVGGEIGFKNSGEFYGEIIEPFTRGGLLVSAGVPTIDGNGTFFRRPEPYYPSTSLILYAEL